MAEKTKEIIQLVSESDLDSDFISFINSERPVVVYGAGRQARLVIDFCNMFDREILCLLTSGSRERWGLLPREDEMPLYTVVDFPQGIDKDKVDVILAVNSKNNAELLKNLKETGFTNCYAISDWNDQNERIRETFYYTYFMLHGAEFIEDHDGERLVVYESTGNKFMTYFPRDPIFKANVLGEFGNIVLPALFNDERMCVLGPYERKPNIEVKEGDVVFDLGASVGLFSCVAASKASKVYAFEPGNMPIYKYLVKNTKLYKNIEVVPYAVGDRICSTPYFFNNMTDIDMDLCQSSIHREINKNFSETTVEMITLDSFVKERNLGKVDFIKSHIEYTEDLMLKGAQNLLKKFYPKLSFYSQKALKTGTHITVENLIKSGNSNYTIEYYKRRVYAY